MIHFTAGGALYETFAGRYPCEKRSLRQVGAKPLAAALKTGDVLIHNAASLNPATLDDGIRDNFLLTREIVHEVLASKADVRFIFISSMSMLGPGGVYKDPLEMNAYSFSKYLAEIYCLKSPLRASSVRFSTLFYKDPARDGMSKMISVARATGAISLLNGGKDTRDFIPLETAVDYLYKIATQQGASGQTLNGMTSSEAGSPAEAGSSAGAGGPAAAGGSSGAGSPSATGGVFNIGSGLTVSFAELAAMIKTALPATTISSVDQPGSAPFVLSHFESAEIERLGRINIDLQTHINDYIKQLG